MKIKKPVQMALRLLFKMVKQLFNNKGYTLLESILVLFISGIMMIILSTNIKYNDCQSVNQIINDIVILQFEAIIENDERYYDLYDMDIVFNRLGNVNHADTYQYKGREIIVSLGTGRVYDYDNEER